MTAPDELEPYAVSLRLDAHEPLQSPQHLVAGLLEDIARRCEDAGASVIGHIKCHAKLAGHAFSCSLTTRHTGALCHGAGSGALAAGGALDLDLAVLVYGLPSAAVEEAVRKALAAALPRSAGTWHTARGAPHHAHGH